VGYFIDAMYHHDSFWRMEPIEIPEPWNPSQATERIRHIARRERLDFAYREGCRDQMAERSLIMGDILYVLRNGFVYLDPEPATRDYWKYWMQCGTPNSNSREVAVLVLPDWKRKNLKVQEVKWVDEPMIGGRQQVKGND
jgi:hypothetical protein